MHVMRLFAAGSLAFAMLAAPDAFAAPCVGFTDVDDTNSFCQNVEWVKNRSVTLGCTSATLYCPADSVNRLAMAAFLNRVGTALTPVFLRKRDPTATFNLATDRIVCVTDQFAVTGFPRTAVVDGMLNAFTPDSGIDIQATIVVSTDNGANWAQPGSNDGVAYGAIYSGFTPPNDVTLRAKTFVDLNVGSSYRFAVRASRQTGAGAVVNLYCENIVQIFNRNGGSSPLDQSDGGPPGRGG